MERGPDPRDRGMVITDVDIPFWRLVAIMIKVVLAAIPAYIVVGIIIGGVLLLIGGLFGGLGMMMQDGWHR